VSKFFDQPMRCQNPSHPQGEKKMKVTEQSVSFASGTLYAFGVLFCINCVWLTDLKAQPMPQSSEVVTLVQEQALEEAFGAAHNQYAQNHWDAAFLSFSRLAEQRHRQSAQIAFQMWKYGPVLYKTDFSASKDQVLRWCTLLNPQPFRRM
jgi:hypothetical protein